MMEEYTEAQAYKRLLQIAESILNSTQTDTNILQKYEKLKAALLAKVTVEPASWQTTYLRKLLQCYKYVTSSVIEAVGEFEAQIEQGQQRQNYNKKVIGVVKEWELRLEQLKIALAEENNQKQKLLMKEEVSALTYYCSEMDGKLENLGLLIQVHGKMHEIICQASKSQVEKASREQQLMTTLRQREHEVREIRNCRKFIQKHNIASQSYNQFKMWSNKLQTVLFQH